MPGRATERQLNHVTCRNRRIINPLKLAQAETVFL